ncbi:MAG: tetratricopeptide repeat protein, partial [bacterium]|nr:tetratricopeptide repeat protein [bacterium]
ADPVRGMAAQIYTQTKSLVYYLRLLIIPRGLSVEHAFRVSDSLGDGAVLAAAGALLSAGLVIAWSVRSRARGRSSSRSSARSLGRPSVVSLPDIFWLAWMPLVLLPTLIVPLNVLVNEHRLYPVTIAAAVLLLRVMGRVQPSWGLSALAGITICFAVMSFQRAQVWGDALTLWSDARDKGPTMPRPYLFVGDSHFQAGRYDEALLAYALAEHVQPDHLTPGDRLALHNNRGATLLALGRTAEAGRSYAEALRIMPDYAPTVQALAALQALARTATRNSTAHDLGRRGLAAMVSGDLAVAEETLSASLQVQQDDRIHLALGLVLERRGKLPEAAQLYRELLESANSSAVLVSAHRRLAGLGEGELAP